MAAGFEFLADFDIFSGGLVSAAIFFAYFWALTYMYAKGRHDKADEFSLTILLPPLLIAFFMAILNFNSLLTGIAVLMAYFLSFRHYTKVEYSDWAKHILIVLIIFMVLAVLDDMLRVILFVFLLGYISISAEHRIHEKRKKEKKEEKD